MKNYVDKHKIVCRLQKSYLQTNEFLKLTNALPFQKLFDIRALLSGSCVYLKSQASAGQKILKRKFGWWLIST